MPIYEYECTSCGHRFEKMVKMGAEAPPCPDCASAEIRKLISKSGFILAGGGWYKDHYGLKSGGDSADSSSASSSKAAATGAKADGAKSEPAAAAAPKVEAPKAEAPKKSDAKAAAAK